MYPTIQSNLGRRILLLVSISMLLILAALVISGWLAVQQTSERVLNERQALAQTTGKYLNYILRQNLERLASVRFAQEVNIEDSNLEPEKRALHSTYLGSIFDEGVFITDKQLNVLWVEPFRPNFVGTNISNYLLVWQSLKTGKPSISNIFTFEPVGKEIILMVTPLHSQEGKIVVLVGGQINPRGRTLQEFTQLIEPGKTIYIDIVDSNGIVLASSDSQRILESEQEIINREEAEITVSASLSTAPWSVVIRQSEKEALSPVRTMEQRFIIFGISSLAVALFLSWGMARSLIRPIGQLTAAAQNISQGNLSQSIPELGSDEIGDLSRSLDTIRSRRKSLHELEDRD